MMLLSHTYYITSIYRNFNLTYSYHLRWVSEKFIVTDFHLDKKRINILTENAIMLKI